MAETFGREHDTYGLALNNAAFLLTRTDRAAEAVPLYREALAIRRAVYGPDHPAVWLALQNLGAAYYYIGELDQAIAIARQRAASIERAYPDGHWRVPAAHEGIGELLLGAGRFAEAETEFRTAIPSYRTILGLDHTWTRVAEAWAVLAMTLQGDERGPALLDRSIATLDGMRFDGDTTADVRKIADFLDAAGMAHHARAFRGLVEGNG